MIGSCEVVSTVLFRAMGRKVFPGQRLPRPQSTSKQEEGSNWAHMEKILYVQAIQGTIILSIKHGSSTTFGISLLFETFETPMVRGPQVDKLRLIFLRS